ncbi:MAG: WD40/YVTN/BNR-like repeat-containing protein [bacterium]
MNIIHKVKQSCLLFISISIVFAAFSCDDKNPADSNGNKVEITWQQSGLDSLRITVLAANSTGSVFAAGCRDGIFRSTDHGATWILLAPDFCLRSMAINSEGIIFAPQKPAFRTFLIRSIDNGESWDSLDVAPFVDIKPIAFNSAGDIFVGSQTSDESRGDIYVSRDNGDSWTQTSFPDSIGTDALAINNAGHIFAGTGFGVYRSTDNGETWTQLNQGFEDLLGHPLVDALAIHPLTDELFAALFSDGVYRLRNDEEGWIPTSLTASRIGTLVFNEKGDIFAGGRHAPPTVGGVFCSRDNGENWRQINSGLTNTDVRALTIDSSGFLYAGSFFPTGVFRSVRSTIQ